MKNADIEDTLKLSARLVDEKFSFYRQSGKVVERLI